MDAGAIPELWVWAEYYCPWCYIAAVRLRQVHGEYEGRVTLRLRFFPLEVPRGERVPRDILEQEWWLAALQEPAAPFAPYPGGDWPTTTLPAFDAVGAASRQGAAAGMAFDLRVRGAFFGEGRNIRGREVLLDLAREVSRRFPAEMPCRVRVALRDGRVLSAELADYPGFLTRGRTWAFVREKFDRLGARYTTPALRDRIVATMSELERFPPS
jgi:hypothetical protein